MFESFCLVALIFFCFILHKKIYFAFSVEKKKKKDKGIVEELEDAEECMDGEADPIYDFVEKSIKEDLFVF